MSQADYLGDINDDENMGDAFLGGPSKRVARVSGLKRYRYIEVQNGVLTSTRLESFDSGFQAARIKYLTQRMQDFAPYRTTVKTTVPDASGNATITWASQDLQADSIYSTATRIVPLINFTFGASSLTAVPSAQSTVTVDWWDSQGANFQESFTIERNTGMQTKVRFAPFRLLFGKAVQDDFAIRPTADAKLLSVSVTGIIGNANFSVTVPGFNDPQLATLAAKLNA